MRRPSPGRRAGLEPAHSHHRCVPYQLGYRRLSPIAYAVRCRPLVIVGPSSHVRSCARYGPRVVNPMQRARLSLDNPFGRCGSHLAPFRPYFCKRDRSVLRKAPCQNQARLPCGASEPSLSICGLQPASMVPTVTPLHSADESRPWTLATISIALWFTPRLPWLTPRIIA
jgi:hypothetical protein